MAMEDCLVRVLGVNCKPGYAYLALAEEGEIVAGVTESIPARALEESSDQLSAALEELARVMTDARADKVVLLKPEGGPKPTRPHSDFVPRIALETVVRLAAVRSGVEIEQLARPTVRQAARSFAGREAPDACRRACAGEGGRKLV